MKRRRMNLKKDFDFALEIFYTNDTLTIRSLYGLNKAFLLNLKKSALWSDFQHLFKEAYLLSYGEFVRFK